MYHQENRRMTSKIDFALLCFMLSVLLFFGWLFQYFGIVSQTQTNFLIMPFLAYFSYKSRFSVDYADAIFFFLLMQVLFSIVWSNASYVFVYVYYLICLYFSIKSAPFICQVLDERCTKIGLRKFFSIFYSIQVLLVSLQYFYVHTYVGLSKASIGLEDAVSGSLYLQSDSTLALLLIVFNIFMRYANFQVSERLMFFLAGSYIVTLGSSKAMLFFYLFSFIFCIDWKGKVSDVAKPAILFLFLAGLTFLVLNFSFQEVFSSFLDEIFYGYADKQFGGDAARLAPIGYFLFENLNIWGDGPLTYFNPITKLWLYNSGLSTFYSFYIDYGLAGLLLFVFFFVGTIVSGFFAGRILDRCFVVICAFVFCFFNFILTDVTAVLAIFGIVFVMRIKNERC